MNPPADSVFGHLMDPLRNDPPNPKRFKDIGVLGGAGVSVTRQAPIIDVESDLLGLPRKATDNPYQKYRPSKGKLPVFHLREGTLKKDYTRISNPLMNSRGVGVNRFEPMYINPQHKSHWWFPNRGGINNRLAEKDKYITVIPKPMKGNPMDPKEYNPRK